MVLKQTRGFSAEEKPLQTTGEMSGLTLQILGIRVNSTSTSSVLDFVGKKLAKGEKFWIATPNPEMVVAAQSDEIFKRTLNSADLAIPDGIGLVWAARILGLPLRKRVTGTDLLVRLCQKATQENWKVVFLGGGEGVAEQALSNLKKQFVGLEGRALEGPKKLLITNDLPAGKAGQLLISDQERNREAIERINAFKPDLLFVGFGMGKQERWVREHLRELKIGGAMVVGGAFDFYAGRVQRAPAWLRNIGFEWLWRLIFEPWRWRRQLSLFRFIWLILKERF